MASLTDAEEALRSADGKDRFHLLTRLLMCGGVRLLREKFDSFHSPADLPLKLGDPAIIAQLKGAKLSKPEWDCLYPSPSTFGKSTDFDITLTFRLLRTICNLTTPPTGWNNLPNSTDHSLEADLVRIKYYRNSVYGHNQKMEIIHSEFCNLWKEISEPLLRIAASISSAKRDEWEKAVDGLLHDPLTTEAQRYVDELQLWYKNDMDIKEAVNQVGDAVIQVGDQLENFNKKLDHMTNLFYKYMESHQPQVPELQGATGSEKIGPELTCQEPLQSGGAEGTSGGHLKENLQDRCRRSLSEVAEGMPVTSDVETPRHSELKLEATVTEKEHKTCQESFQSERKVTTCFAKIFNECPLHIYCTGIWVNPSTGEKHVIIGAEEGVYSLKLIETIHEAEMDQVCAKRCTWLAVFHNVMVALQGSPSCVYIHDLKTLHDRQQAFNVTVKRNRRISETRGCSKCRVVNNPFNSQVYLCVALQKSVLLYQWFEPWGRFMKVQNYDVDIPSPPPLFEPLIKQDLEYPLICVGVRETSDGNLYFECVNLNSLSSWLTELPEGKKLDIDTVDHLEKNTVLVAFNSAIPHTLLVYSR